MLRVTVSQGNNAYSWNTTPRSTPGPVTALPSTVIAAAVGGDETAEDVEQRALAAARGSDDGDELALRYVDADIGQGRDIAVAGLVALVEVTDAYAGHAEQG